MSGKNFWLLLFSKMGAEWFDANFHWQKRIYFGILKVPKCEIFDPFFFTSLNPKWVGDLRTGEKKKIFRRPRQIFAILFFLRRLSLR
jgi:hypothetical protein